MQDKGPLSAYALGSVQRADRIQRLVIGGLLMLLTIIGFTEHIEWRGVVAFLLQAELLLTGIVGWCPIYWGCNVTMGEQ